MDIIQAPDEVLRTAVKTVELPPEKLKKIIVEMTATLVAQSDPEGVGLAANQVGLPCRLFLARFGTKKNEPVHVFINPEILEHSGELQPEEEKNAALEGCLSVPKYYGVVKRWKWIKIKYIDDSGVVQSDVFAGFPATVIQHEMDHLGGKIFVERILEQQGKLYKINGKDKKGKETWEEVEF